MRWRGLPVGKVLWRDVQQARGPQRGASCTEPGSGSETQAVAPEGARATCTFSPVMPYLPENRPGTP